MKKLISGIVLAGVLVGVLLAQTPRTTYAPPTAPSIHESWWPALKAWIRYEEEFGRSNTPRYLGTTIAAEGRVYMTVLVPGAGDTLFYGDVAIWDSTGVAVCDTTENDTARIEDDLSDIGGKCLLYVVTGGTASSDSLKIIGLDADGASQSETLVITDGAASITISAYEWSEIDSVYDSQAATGWDDYSVIAVPVCAVRVGSAVGSFAGIVGGFKDATGAWQAYIPPGGIGWITTHGITSAYVDGGTTNVFPGDQLIPTSSGDLIPFSATGLATVAITQDSLNTVDYDLANIEDDPIDSLTSYQSGVITASLAGLPVATALGVAVANNQLIRVFVK